MFVPITTREIEDLERMLDTGDFVHRYALENNVKEYPHYYKIWRAGPHDYRLAAIDRLTHKEIDGTQWLYPSLHKLLWRLDVVITSWFWIRPSILTCVYPDCIKAITEKMAMNMEQPMVLPYSGFTPEQVAEKLKETFPECHLFLPADFEKFLLQVSLLVREKRMKEAFQHC